MLTFAYFSVGIFHNAGESRQKPAKAYIPVGFSIIPGRERFKKTPDADPMTTADTGALSTLLEGSRRQTFSVAFFSRFIRN
jgi:hypothetical protein